MVERHVWDVEVPGSSPGTPTRGLRYILRVWFNGRIGAFQAFDGGSIPPTRSLGFGAANNYDNVFFGRSWKSLSVANLINAC